MRLLQWAMALTLLLPLIVRAQTISGRLTDDQGEPLSGGNILILGTNTGTAANRDGYYSLNIHPGTIHLRFSFIGYVSDTLTVTVQKGQTLQQDVRLSQSTLQMGTIEIFPTRYNSAEEVILQAISKKQKYLSALRNYEYAAYSQTSFIPIRKDSAETIGGIAEIQSRGYFQAPDDFQEIVFARRQTANFSEVFNIFSTGKILSILDDMVSIDELSVMSPLNPNALGWYRFAMIDTSMYEGRRVFNISVTPVASSFPLFEGRISIIDDIFTVTDVELYGKERIQSTLKSKIVLRQVFREFESQFWLPVQFSLTYVLDIGLPGVQKLRIRQQSTLTDYVINDPGFQHRFDNRIIRKADIEHSMADSIWEQSQRVGLTDEERTAYKRIDSAMATKSFVIKTLLKLPGWYLIVKNLPITDVSDYYHYNRTDGNYLGFGYVLQDGMESMKLRLNAGYGFGDKKAKYSVSADAMLFSDVLQMRGALFQTLNYLNANQTYRRIDITFRQLLLNRDYADYYYARGWSGGIVWNAFSDLQASLDISSEQDVSATNTSSAALFNRNRESRQAVSVLEGAFRQLTLSLGYDDRKFIDYGWGSVQDMSHDFTRARFEYGTAPKSIAGNDHPFQRYHLFANVYQKLSPYANVNISLLLGHLDNSAYIQRSFHFPGSYGSFSYPNQFRSLREDSYLGTTYACVFLENNFKNTIFNALSLPFLKNSKYDLYISGNFGWIESTPWEGGPNIPAGQNRISEIGFGVGNIFFFMRMDFTWRLAPRENSNFNFNISTTVND